MGSNSFGKIFKITTWGESHGKAIGVVIDGCPAGLSLDETIINTELAKRAPGFSSYTSPRKEDDCAEILSGVFEGQTTGAPIMIMIPNKDADPSKYEPIKHLMRPGHANFTYLEKYGVFDYRGGGRSSARETACRVAAGAVAKQLLSQHDIQVEAYMKQIGDVSTTQYNVKHLQMSPVRCPDTKTSEQMVCVLEEAMEQGDSLGGVIQFSITGLPAGLGDPVYEKLEANLAKAMLSIPATKGFEIGEGFAAPSLHGSEHNDEFHSAYGKITPSTNRAGGTLGGISTGQPVVGRVAFKPTSSIRQAQQTVDENGKEAKFQLPEGSRHDPCVAIRAVPVVESMAALVVADALLMNRSARLS
ncbi:MAG: Chorismate synthase [Chlamydiae bacterium]|nr:Chorismate synthase [Chlamydiota bacterium]